MPDTRFFTKSAPKTLGELAKVSGADIGSGSDSGRLIHDVAALDNAGPEQITFLDVYKAVECAPDEQLFHFHENPNQKCPVGKNIHHVLDKRLLEVQRAMEEKLSEMTLADVKKEIAAYT